MKQFCLFLLMIAGFAQPAFSQADHLFDIYDQPFGLSSTHVYFLRTTQDNLADYDTTFRDVYLIAKNLETGLDDQIWPVSRVKLDVDDLDNTLSVQSHALQNASNPFAILAKGDAVFGLAQMRDVGDEYAAEITFDWDGITLMDSKILLVDTFAQIQASIDVTVQAIQPYPQSAGAPATIAAPQELLSRIALTPENCEPSSVSAVALLGQNARVPLARLLCYDDNFEITFAVIVVLPKVET